MWRPSAKLIRISLIASFYLTVMGLGGVLKEVIFVGAITSLCTLFLAALRRRRISIDRFGGVLFAFLILTCIQIIPLPLSLIDTLSPMTADVARRGAVARGLAPPTSAPLSLDPQSTGLAILWWTSVLCTYLTTRQLQAQRNEQTTIVLSIIWLGVLVVLTGLVHAVLNLDTVYGLYEPGPLSTLAASDALFRAVFLNPNHLAAFLGCGAILALSWTSAPDCGGRARIFYYSAFILLSLGVILTASRAGILSTGVACLLVILLSKRPRERAGLLLGFAIASTLIVFSPIGHSIAEVIGIGDWSETTHYKTHLLSLEVLTRWPLMGVGRGGFGVAHTMVAPDLHYYLTHAHNTPIQVLTDYGWPVGGLLLLSTAALIISPWRHMMKSPLGIGVVASLFALCIHNLVDFSLDILGVAVTAIILVSTIRATVTGLRVPRAVSIACIVIALLSSAGLYLTLGPEAGPRREKLISTDVELAMDLYPADAYAYLAASVARSELALARHAAWLHEKEPNIQLAVAALGGPAERPAALRAALSTVRSYQLRERCFRLIRATLNTPKEVLEALPNPELAAHFISWLPSPSVPFLNKVTDTFPTSFELQHTIGRIHLQANRLGLADDVATRLIINDSPLGYKLMGAIFMAQKKPLRAHHMFIAAGDTDSKMQAARIAVEARLGQRALSTLDSIGASPQHLREIRALRTVAEELVRTSNGRVIRAVDIFRSGATPVAPTPSDLDRNASGSAPKSRERSPQ